MATLTIAVLNQKGGVGKTSLATNLAAAAHLEGLRTLVVDMDRQGSALDWSAARVEGSKLDGLTVVKADKALPLGRLREMAKGYACVILDGPPRLGDITRSAAVLMHLHGHAADDRTYAESPSVLVAPVPLALSHGAGLGVVLMH